MPDIYQIKIALTGSKPPIWRRVLIPAEYSLKQLHHVIQCTLNWQDCHLHEFYAGKKRYGIPDPDLFGSSGEMDDVKDDRRVRLFEVFQGLKSKATYVYDFGDDWHHTLLLEQVLPADPNAVYPRCIAGKRNGPPEDCGGIYGYKMLLAALKDRRHPDHADLTEWIGGAWDAEAFPIHEINTRLEMEFKPRRRRRLH